MADLSKIRWNGTEYNLKDAAARELISGLNSFEVSIVSSLPAANIKDHTIYFVTNGSTYDEYMYINNNWEKLGSTDIDLSGYLRTTDIASWAKASTKPSYTASEVGALPNTTTIPTKTSDLTNDSGFITSAPVTSVNGQTGAVTLSIPSATTVTQTLTSGTKIGEVNGTSLYAPAGSSITISNTLSSGTLIATINGTNIYAPSYTNGDGVSY